MPTARGAPTPRTPQPFGSFRRAAAARLCNRLHRRRRQDARRLQRRDAVRRDAGRVRGGTLRRAKHGGARRHQKVGTPNPLASGDKIMPFAVAAPLSYSMNAPLVLTHVLSQFSVAFSRPSKSPCKQSLLVAQVLLR